MARIITDVIWFYGTEFGDVLLLRVKEKPNGRPG